MGGLHSCNSYYIKVILKTFFVEICAWLCIDYWQAYVKMGPVQCLIVKTQSDSEKHLQYSLTADFEYSTSSQVLKDDKGTCTIV